MAAAKAKGILRSYFVAQIDCTLACWFAQQAWGFGANWYRAVYSAATLAVLVCSALLVVEMRASRWNFALSAFFVVPLAAWCYEDATRHDVDFWIVGVEAVALSFLGCSMALKSHVELPHTRAILSVLWLSLAAYDFMWLVRPRSEILNYIVPSYLVATGSFCVAWYEPRKRIDDTLRTS